MQFAVNYSLPLEKLLLTGKVEVDLLKCPDWQGVIHAARRLRPVYVHFEIAVGNGQVPTLDYDVLRAMFTQTHTPHLNCHLIGNSTLDPGSRNDQLKQIREWVEELTFIRNNLPDVPLVAENLPITPLEKGSRIGADPDLIRETLLATETDLLFDLSHARISCGAMEYKLTDYVSQLPMQHLRELHLTGLRRYHGLITDHFELSDSDWQAADWAQQQILSGEWRQPEIVALEYGGVGDVFGWRTQPDALLAQVPRLQAMFGNHATSFSPPY
jgi:uncharacterized protein (UPF0276 family)